MKLVFKDNGMYIYSFKLRTDRLEYYLIDNVSGIIATFSINDNSIYSFNTGEAYCFNNHEYYIKTIKKAGLIVE